MKILILPGDGIGPEIVGPRAVRVLEKFKAEGVPIETVARTARRRGARRAWSPVSRGDAAAGARGGRHPARLRRRSAVRHAAACRAPSRGLLGIRKDLKLFANLRPAMLYPELAASSSLKPEVVAGLDIMIIREA